MAKITKITRKGTKFLINGAEILADITIETKNLGTIQENSRVSIFLNQKRFYEPLSKLHVNDILEKFDYTEIFPRDVKSDAEIIELGGKKFLFEINDIEIFKKNTGNSFRKSIYCNFEFKERDWDKYWGSINDFVETFKNCVSEADNSIFNTPEEVQWSWGDNRVGGFFREEILDSYGLDSMIKTFLDILYLAQEKAVGILAKNHDNPFRKNDEYFDIFSELFDFPEEVKTACSQYLLYFREFLKDIGIKAETEITNQDSGKVLFSVIPEDKDEALYKIREALQVYLQLPKQEPEFPNQPDPSIQILYMQITNLRSQLMLKTTALEQQRATIQREHPTFAKTLLDR